MASCIEFRSCDRTPCDVDTTAGYHNQVQMTMGETKSAEGSEDIGGVVEQANEGASDIDDTVNTVRSLADAIKNNTMNNMNHNDGLNMSKAATAMGNSWKDSYRKSHLFVHQQNRSKRRRTSPTPVTLV